MDRQKLRSWVKKKLDAGVSEQRLKHVLEEKGHDPAVVEQVSGSINNRQRRGNQGSQQHQGTDSPPAAGPASNRAERPGDSFSTQTQETAASPSAGPDGSNRDNSFGSSSDTDFDFEQQPRQQQTGRQDTGRNRSSVLKLVLPVLLLAGIAAGVMYSPVGIQEVTGSFPDASAIIPSGGGSGPAAESFEGTKVKLGENAAVPSRPSVSPGEEVMFASEVDYPLEVSFRSGKSGFTLQPGGSRVTSFDSLTYYTAEPVGVEAATVRGSVYAR